MVLVKGGYVPVGYRCHEGLWVLPITVLHQKSRGMLPSLYNGISFLDGDYRDEAGWHTWKIYIVRPLKLNGFL